jgi:hypothetical protein
MLQAMQTHEACELARAAVNDGATDSSGLIAGFAKCGADGRHPGNELRDFRRAYRRHFSSTLAPMLVKLTLKDENRSGAVHSVLTPILAPHEVFHHLYHEGGLATFKEAMVGDNIELADYWSTLMQQDWSSDHPMRAKRDVWDRTVPLLFFTDGAEFSKGSAAEGSVSLKR